jgi:peptidoglycan/LPS O-acetylase OafA/YrhL
MEREKGKGRRLSELDALRGIGAIAVVLFHYTTRFHEMFPAAHHVPYSFIGGNYRVLLFFAISGFAIFFTLDRINGPADFVMNRLSRLYPVYWAAILLTVLVEYAGRVSALQIPPWAVLANFSMLEGFAFVPQVDGAYWTLTVEIAFYACMIALWLSPWRHRLEPVLLVWLAAKWLFALWPGMPERIVMLLVLRYLPFFAIGMLSHRVWSGRRTWRQQWPCFAAVLVTTGALERPDYLLAAILLILCFVALVEGRLAFLSVRPLLWLGSISYSLYLVHQHIGFVVMLKADQMGMSPRAGCALAIVVALGLGAGLNRYVERPAQRLIEGWWRSHGPRGYGAKPA